MPKNNSMLKINEYFDGNVKSIAFDTSECPATAGVMQPGEYEFGTTSNEYVTVVSGVISVKLPGMMVFRDYKPYETFIVPKDVTFHVKVQADAAYICLYK